MPEQRRTWSPRWSCRRWPKPLEPTTASTKKLPAASWTVGLRVLWYEMHSVAVCLRPVLGRKSAGQDLNFTPVGLKSSWNASVQPRWIDPAIFVVLVQCLYSFFVSWIQIIFPQGSVYQKTNAMSEIRKANKGTFWAQAEVKTWTHTDEFKGSFVHAGTLLSVVYTLSQHQHMQIHPVGLFFYPNVTGLIVI